jgi:hypothetical protein
MATWVIGTVNGHSFSAKIYGAHAANQNWELGRSRISKLHLRRDGDDRTVFNWDRGLETPRKDPLGKEKATMAIVDFLTTGALENFGFSEVRDRREFAKAHNRRPDLKPEIRYEH